MRVAVMRPRDRLLKSADIARELGLEPICASPVEIVINDSHSFTRFIESASEGKVDAVAFTSASGVEAAMELAQARGRGDEMLEILRSIDVLVIGLHTRAPLVSEGVEVAIMPDEFSSEGMVRDIPRDMIKGRRIWILRSDMGSKILPKGLRESGGLVEEVAVYHLRKNLDGNDVIALLDKGNSGGIDGFAFTSSLSAKTILEAGRRRLGKEAAMEMMKNAVVGAIGNPTRKALEEEGVRVDTVPRAADFRLLLMSMRELI
ncbi:MAG: uroporphyrinogen-III synthase [Methanomassiliicoccales archaeon]|nr:uroporphyrinogen-III synthase [Methanomassiliicoccales archaeon]NYT15576.1 uroporphyrinogen-III synthase [Methanomassiliicoccales archaeon]